MGNAWWVRAEQTWNKRRQTDDARFNLRLLENEWDIMWCRRWIDVRNLEEGAEIVFSRNIFSR